MKHNIVYIVLIVITFGVFSCCKNKKINIESKENDCPQMYDARSEPYINPYFGTLETGTTIPPNHIYPEKYCYWYPCINPNNEFEFCYLRRENGIQSSDDMDLYKYNFCSGKSTLVTKHVAYGIDWSVKDWIIFTGQNKDLWKIKSNGDSLTQLTFLGAFQNDAHWNTTGTMFIWNNSKVADQFGNVKYTLPNMGQVIGWYDEFNILNTFQGANNVSITNVSNSNSSYFANIVGNGYINYNKRKNEFLGAIDSATQFKKSLIYNLSTNTVKYLSFNFNPPSFLTNIYFQMESKLLIQQVLRDTMTGTPSLLNYRSHIAIMDNDGTNERQVILPE